jgi:hypothetical protein
MTNLFRTSYALLDFPSLFVYMPLRTRLQVVRTSSQEIVLVPFVIRLSLSTATIFSLLSAVSTVLLRYSQQ